MEGGWLGDSPHAGLGLRMHGFGAIGQFPAAGRWLDSGHGWFAWNMDWVGGIVVGNEVGGLGNNIIGTIAWRAWFGLPGTHVPGSVAGVSADAAEGVEAWRGSW